VTISQCNRRLVPNDDIAEIDPGVRVGELYRALDSIAIWIPSRKGPLLFDGVDARGGRALRARSQVGQWDA
jgi:histidinol dehydrogenase